jgi:hypothetical protein
MGADGYRRLGAVGEDAGPLEIADPPHLDLSHPRIAPGIHPRVF